VRNIDTAPEQDVTKSRVDLGLGDYAIYSRTGRNFLQGMLESERMLLVLC
jgi:hypothetical protein